MLELQDLNVWISPPEKNYLLWKYKSTGDNINDYLITIERAINSPADMNFVPIVTLPAATNVFVDYPVNHYSLNIFYYRAVIRHVSDPTRISVSSPSFFKILNDREVLTILENEMMYLKRYVRRPLLLYIAKKEGPKCECYDEYRQSPKYSDCKVCFGTGYWGGFYGPIDVYMQFSTQNRQTQHTEAGEVNIGQFVGWTVAFPQMTPGDVLLDVPLGNVYVVQDVRLTEWYRHPIKQAVQLIRPERSHPAYLLLSTLDYWKLMPAIG